MNDKEQESPFLLEELEEATKEDKEEENKTFQYTIISEDNVYKIKNQDNQKVEINESENPNLKKCLDEILESFKTKQNGNSNKKIFIYLKLDNNNNIISGEIKIGNKGSKENFELSDEIKKELQNTLFCLKNKFIPEQVKDTIEPVKSLDADSVVSDSEPQPQPVPEEIKSQDNKYWEDILKEEKIMPDDGNCLFWSAMMAYLDPFKDDEEQFKINCMKLFGNQNNWEVLFNNFSKISNTGHKDNNFKDSNDYKTIKSSMLKFRTNVIEHMEKFATPEDVEIFLTEEFVEDFNEKNKNNSILKAENLLPLAANDLKNYCLIMKKDGVFADQFELKFISKFLECNVIFFQDNVISSIGNIDNGFKENIVLNYVNKDHYNYYSYAHNSVNHEKQVLVTASNTTKTRTIRTRTTKFINNKKQLNEIKNSDELTLKQKNEKSDTLSSEFKDKRVAALENFEKYINSKRLLSKLFLVLFSPLTIPYAAIKSVNHKLRKTKNPKIYLEDDIKTLKQFKEDLDKKYEAIRIKYAKLMAIPLEERSIFSIKKTDSDYLKAAQIEIEKAIFQFQLKCKAITDHYENFVTKQDSKFSSKVTTIKKMEDILEKNGNYSINNVENDLKERMTEPDYERQELSHNMKRIITSANGLSEDLVANLKGVDIPVPQLVTKL